MWKKGYRSPYAEKFMILHQTNLEIRAHTWKDELRAKLQYLEGMNLTH